MKIRIQHGPLADALAWVSSCTPMRPVAPVLAGVKLTASDDGTLTLTAFDYEMSATATLEAVVNEPGVALVSARLFSAIVKELPKGQPVTLAERGTRLDVSVKSGSFSLPEMPVEDYPELPPMPAQVGEIAAEDWAHAIKRVAPATSRDDALPALTGIALEFGQSLTVAATDRYRLAAAELAWQPTLDDDLPGRLLVPATALAAGAFAEADRISLHASEAAGVVGLSTDRRRLTSRLIDAPFPDHWRKLVPRLEDASATVTAPSGELDAMLRRAGVLAAGMSERTADTATLTFAEGGIVVASGYGDDATGEELLPTEYDGESMTVTVQVAYLRDAIKTCGTDHVSIALGVGPTKPFVLRPTSDDGSISTTYQHLVMPIRPPHIAAAA